MNDEFIAENRYPLSALSKSRAILNNKPQAAFNAFIILLVIAMLAPRANKRSMNKDNGKSVG